MEPEVAIIVPVLWRPQNAVPFVGTLRSSMGGDMGRVVVTAIADREDRATAKAWRDVGADVITIEPPAGTGPGTFSSKVNHAFRWLTDEGPHVPWMLLLGDDVAFHAGWLDAALTVAADTSAQVVCTNDLGFHKDATGGTHPLISWDYALDLGASWDGPGVVCHEGYRHYYVDAEIMAVAKHRDTWAPAAGAVIEHMHHVWHKAPVDPTYQLATDNLHRDRDLFYDRLAIYRPPEPVADPG